jgi:hypothetical protein
MSEGLCIECSSFAPVVSKTVFAFAYINEIVYARTFSEQKPLPASTVIFEFHLYNALGHLPPNLLACGLGLEK